MQHSNTIFITGNRSDKLLQHKRDRANVQSSLSCHESLLWLATDTTVADVVKEAALVTANESAFTDALCCVYFLMKREIVHTTNFAELQSLCVLLGNAILALLNKAKNLNYLSKQTMGEMVAVIGLALEREILQELQQSRYFSIIFNEATVYVTKSLRLCIQYLDVDVNVKVRALALIKLH